MVVPPWKHDVFGPGRCPSRRPTAPLPRRRAHLQAISDRLCKIDRKTASRLHDLPCGVARRSAHWVGWSDPPTARAPGTTCLLLLGDLAMNAPFPNSPHPPPPPPPLPPPPPPPPPP